MEQVLGSLAENREWGLILLFAFIGWLWANRVQKSNDRREKRLTDAFMTFSEEFPKLTSAIETNNLCFREFQQEVKSIIENIHQMIQTRDEKAHIYMDTIDSVQQEVTVHADQIDRVSNRVDVVEVKTANNTKRITAVEESMKPSGRKKSGKQ